MWIDYGLVAAIVNDSMPEIPKLVEKGINVFKIFMGETVGGVPAPDDGGILKALKWVAEAGLRVGVHAENNAIMDFFKAELQKAGRTVSRGLAVPPTVLYPRN